MLRMLVLRKILLTRQKTNSARWIQTFIFFSTKNVNCNAIIYIENILENEIDRIWQRNRCSKLFLSHQHFAVELFESESSMLWCLWFAGVLSFWYVNVFVLVLVLRWCFFFVAIRFFWLAIVINDRLTRTNGIYKHKHNCVLPQKC